MSVVTSMNQLQMSSFSADAARIVPGSTITVTCKLKNTSGETIKSMSVGVGLMEKAFPNHTANAYVFTYAMGSRMQTESVGSWAAGKSKTFTWTVTLPDSELAALFDKYSTRAMPLVLYFVTANSADEGSNDTYVCDVVGNSVTVLNSFCTPTVEKFEVARTPDDESSTVAVSIKLAQSESAYSNSAWKPSCELRYKLENENDFSSIDLTSMIQTLLEGVAGNTDIVAPEIPTQYDCDFKIVFEDAYESASRSTDVPNAFANFALSETGAGASFGMFPTSTADEPKLESAYPGYFYAGIVDFGSGEHCTASQRAMGVQSGALEQITGVDGGKYSDTAVTFPQAFKDGTVPVVIAGFRTSSASSAFGNCACSVHTVSNTGFIVRFYNGDTTKRAPGFNWIAIGQV